MSRVRADVPAPLAGRVVVITRPAATLQARFVAKRRAGAQ